VVAFLLIFAALVWMGMNTFKHSPPVTPFHVQELSSKALPPQAQEPSFPSFPPDTSLASTYEKYAPLTSPAASSPALPPPPRTVSLAEIDAPIMRRQGEAGSKSPPTRRPSSSSQNRSPAVAMASAPAPARSPALPTLAPSPLTPAPSSFTPAPPVPQGPGPMNVSSSRIGDLNVIYPIPYDSASAQGPVINDGMRLTAASMAVPVPVQVTPAPPGDRGSCTAFSPSFYSPPSAYPSPDDIGGERQDFWCRPDTPAWDRHRRMQGLREAAYHLGPPKDGRSVPVMPAAYVRD
jgi:hypothetical protein